jgi:hypothetical protein
MISDFGDENVEYGIIDCDKHESDLGFLIRHHLIYDSQKSMIL